MRGLTNQWSVTQTRNISNSNGGGGACWKRVKAVEEDDILHTTLYSDLSRPRDSILKAGNEERLQTPSLPEQFQSNSLLKLLPFLKPGVLQDYSVTSPKIRWGNLNHMDVWWRHNRCQQVSCKWTTGAVVETAPEPLCIIVRQNLIRLTIFMITDHQNHCFNDEKWTIANEQNPRNIQL